MKYTSESDILEVVEGFENCTIKRGSWGHPEHLILAYHYSIGNDFETALKKMKTGIFKLLEAFEVDLSMEMPYHETMTIFWMKTVFDFSRGKTGYDASDINDMINKFDKHYPSRFYSHDLLFSDESRVRFIEPDLANFDY